MAGAGCGKTRVLTDRYLGELDSPHVVGLSPIVALTFTEKAARELRDRVRRACRERMEHEANTSATTWRSVLWALETAPVSTFHSFCARLLRRYPIEAGVVPGFAVADEVTTVPLRDAALARSVRRWLSEQNPDLIELAASHGLAPILDALLDLSAERAGRPYAELAERSVPETLQAWNAVWDAEVLPLLKGRLLGPLTSCAQFLAPHTCSLKTMASRLDRFRALAATFSEDPLGPASLQELRELLKLQGGRATHWSSSDVWEDVKECVQWTRKLIDDVLACMTWDDRTSEQVAEQAAAVARLAVDFAATYDALKRDRGVLDFSDLQERVLLLLRRGAAPVLEAIRSGIRLILVDEFQDTDPVQSEILERLVQPDSRRGKLFLVGDIKQSIYGFRGSRPELLGQFRNAFPEAGRLGLTENFRSHAGIVRFINTLFGAEYPGPEHELRAARPAPPDDDLTTPRVELIRAAFVDDSDANRTRREGREEEARWIARRLAQRLADGWPVQDVATRSYRSAHPGDIALLFRTLNDAAPYERALVDAGLDYRVVGGSAFFVQQEVIDLINVLSVIEDPFDEVALAGFLRSPFCGMSDEGLYWLSTSPHGGLPEGCRHVDRLHDLAGRDRRRVERGMLLLSRWRDLKDQVPMASLLDRVLDDSGFEAALLCEPLGDRKRANCRKLVRLARRHDESGELALADFVRRLRADLSNPPREDQAATTDEDAQAVRLMSIHQAKGLEFPIVVLPDLDRKGAAPPARFAYRDGLGVIVKGPGDDAADPSDEDAGGRSDKAVRCLGWEAGKILQKADDEAEAVRLFYVATTRARDWLLLSSLIDEDTAPRSVALRLLDQRFDTRSGIERIDESSKQPPMRLSVVDDPPPPRTSGPSDDTRRKRGSRLRVASIIERDQKWVWNPSPRSESVPDLAVAPHPSCIDIMAGRMTRSTAPTLELIGSIAREWSCSTSDACGLERVVHRAARRVLPAPSSSLLRRSLARVAPWLEHHDPRDDSTELGQVSTWHMLWPNPEVERATFLFSGRLDLLARDFFGRRHAVVFGLSEHRGKSGVWHRLCLALGTRALPARASGARPLLIWLDVDGIWEEERPGTSDEDIAQLVRQAVALTTKSG